MTEGNPRPQGRLRSLAADGMAPRASPHSADQSDAPRSRRSRTPGQRAHDQCTQGRVDKVRAESAGDAVLRRVERGHRLQPLDPASDQCHGSHRQPGFHTACAAPKAADPARISRPLPGTTLTSWGVRSPHWSLPSWLSAPTAHGEAIMHARRCPVTSPACSCTPGSRQHAAPAPCSGDTLGARTGGPAAAAVSRQAGRLRVSARLRGPDTTGCSPMATSGPGSLQTDRQQHCLLDFRLSQNSS
jgi:hypothetical protein